jgi:hypothetical protein
MKDIIIVILLGIILSMIFLNLPREEGRWYDCTWAEISPDIPPKVKDECRKIRSGKIT